MSAWDKNGALKIHRLVWGVPSQTDGLPVAGWIPDPFGVSAILSQSAGCLSGLFLRELEQEISGCPLVRPVNTTNETDPTDLFAWIAL